MEQSSPTPIARPSDAAAYTIAGVSGAALWLGTSYLTGRHEAWDAPRYWTFAYPLAIVVAAALAYSAPVRPWRWGLTIMLIQAVTMAMTGSSFTLLPLGLVMFAALAIPPIVVASVAARLSSS